MGEGNKIEEDESSLRNNQNKCIRKVEMENFLGIPDRVCFRIGEIGISCWEIRDFASVVRRILFYSKQTSSAISRSPVDDEDTPYPLVGYDLM